MLGRKGQRGSQMKGIRILSCTVSVCEETRLAEISHMTQSAKAMAAFA